MHRTPHYLKSFVIVLSGFLLVATSCKKTNDGNNNGAGDNYYIKFKANGEQKEYKSEADITLLPKKDGVYPCLLQGYKDFSMGARDEIGLFVFSNDAIVSGSFFHDPLKAVKTNGDTLTQLTFNYNDPAKVGYLSMGTLVYANGTSGFPWVVADAQLTITELTATYAKGTFSGTTYKSSDPTITEKQLITGGEFYLKRIQ